MGHWAWTLWFPLLQQIDWVEAQPIRPICLKLIQENYIEFGESGPLIPMSTGPEESPIPASIALEEVTKPSGLHLPRTAASIFWLYDEKWHFIEEGRAKWTLTRINSR